MPSPTLHDQPALAGESAQPAPRLRVGLFAIGLEAYWSQFEGLRKQLDDYAAQLAQRLGRTGVEIVNLGMIDSPEKAAAAGHAFRRADVDLLFLHVTTYALSSTVLPVVRRAKVPVIILNLSPGAAIDYASFNAMTDRGKMTGEWLAWCQACPVPEIANVFRRCHIPFFQITGMLENDPAAWNEIDEWLAAAQVAHTMEHNRLGVMGHYYGGMLDVYSDLTLQCATFGGHIEIVEVDELAALRGDVSPSKSTPRRPLPRGLRRAARLLPATNSPAPPALPSRSTASSSATTSARSPTTTRAPAIPPTKTPSAPSSSAPACSPRAAFPSPANAKSKTPRP